MSSHLDQIEKFLLLVLYDGSVILLHLDRNVHVHIGVVMTDYAFHNAPERTLTDFSAKLNAVKKGNRYDEHNKNGKLGLTL